MDGNGRWAQARGLSRGEGHKAGRMAVREVIRHADELGIPSLTLYAFSTENWQRPADEVGGLMQLFQQALEGELPRLKKNNVRMRFIGERSRFPLLLRTAMTATEAALASNTGLQVNIAVGYGGQWDIAHAAQALANAKQPITEESLSKAVCLADQAPVDLMIRTSGEQRISNFLLWQSAYAELYFCDTLWPDFDAAALDVALAWFSERQRRFGGV